MNHFASKGSALAAALLLAACGGGDGGADSASPEDMAVADNRAAKVERAVGDALASAYGSEPRAAALARLQNAPARKSIYIVQMKDAPVTAYTGGVAGFAATKHARGSKVNPRDGNVVRYGDHLAAKHDAKVARAGARKLYSYRYVFNGFAAEMSEAQAEKLRADADIAAVTKDEIAKLDTATTPRFLGLDARNGLWSQLSGRPNGNPVTPRGPNSSGAGEGVVIGILDSGIWPENPSFSDRNSLGRLVYQQLPGWNGKCVPGEAFTASDCNQKLISAQWFGEGFGGGAAIKEAFPYEYISARAADGHGVHTASTAAGNYDVPASAEGITLGNISGMAPRARVAVYKNCWGISPEGGCANSDSVAAIDQAVADGVDVINFSISGTRTNFRDPVEIAFLFAADAGVFVAASAGNDGTASSVAHPSPWITTVAASTHDRGYANTLTLGNGAVIQGVSLTAGVGPASIVNSDAVVAAGANPADAALCFPGTLDATKVAGKIVVCDRGVNARVEKSQVVRDAGGVGMVLANVSAASLNADIHFVPSIHIAHTDRAAVRAYAAGAGATATISAGQVITATAPLIASFSSRGPLQAGAGDLLKPDITAPGVDIIAAFSPAEIAGRNFDILSGTSMSSPHIAGIAALFKQRHPTWSPMAIKSAMMTTAYQTTKTGAAGQVFGTPFDFGAGHVDPNRAVNPGLVFDSGFDDWLGFLCGTQLPASNCTDAGVPVLDPSDFNVASVAIGDLAGTQTVKRTVTNVSGASATFTALPQFGLAGMTVAVNPASFTLAAGASTTLSITITNVSAPINTYGDGAIVWTSNAGHSVRVPVVVRPVPLAAPVQVSGTGSAMSWDVTFGYTGPFAAALRGLILPQVTPGTVEQDPDQTFVVSDPTGTVAIPFSIPPGSTYARIALFDSDVAAGTDLDLYIYQGTSLVGSSATGTSQEEVNFAFTNPTTSPINLVAYVHGWGVPAGTSPFALNVWTLGTANAGNAALSAPSAATLGAKGSLTLTPDAALGSGRWLGSVIYSGAAGMPRTIIRVDK